MRKRWKSLSGACSQCRRTRRKGGGRCAGVDNGAEGSGLIPLRARRMERATGMTKAGIAAVDMERKPSPPSVVGRVAMLSSIRW